MASRERQERQERVAGACREFVDWAGEVAFKAGSGEYRREAVTAREIIHHRASPKLSRIKPLVVPVWTSPAVVINQTGVDKFRVAVTKIDEIGQTRRARAGFFEVGQDVLDKDTRFGVSANNHDYRQPGNWLPSPAVGGRMGSHNILPVEAAKLDEINLAMADRIWFPEEHLGDFETQIRMLRLFRQVVDTAIASNSHNELLFEPLATPIS